MSTIRPYQAVPASVAAVTALRGAAGIYIPNHNFRDWNRSLYYDLAVDGEDGNDWDQGGFRGWYVPDGGQVYNNAYGTTGKVSATGYYDATSLYLSALAATSGEDIENTNTVLASTIFTGHLPFYRFFQSHHLKPITLAMVVDFSGLSGWSPAWGDTGQVTAYLACYNEDHEFCSEVNGDWDSGVETYAANPIELVFDEDGEALTDGWQHRLAHSKADTAMCAATRYVQLYLGIRGDGVHTLGMSLARVSLMLNPSNADAVTDADPDYFLDLSSVYLSAPPAMNYGQLALQDVRMADGRLLRVNAQKGGPVERADLAWYSEAGATKQKLLTLWTLSTQGLGAYVPEPVPLCLDAGMGQLPWFGYYHAVGDFAAGFNPYWTPGNQGYDVGFSIIGVG